MTAFTQDVIRILLDKLLLGTIAAVFGLYLARLLENHRTKNAYMLSLLQQRLSASRELMTLVVEQHHRVVALWEIWKRIEKQGDGPTEDDLKTAKEYVDGHTEFRKQSAALVPFAGDGVLGILSAYLNETAVVIELTKGGTRRPTDDGLSAALIAFQVGLNKQLSRAPLTLPVLLTAINLF